MGLRVDRFVSQEMPWRSRRDVVALIDAGKVRVNGVCPKKSLRVSVGDRVDLVLPRRDDVAALAQVPLHIVHEDDDLVVVDKPGGLAVHPASTCPHLNLLRRLEHHFASERNELGVVPSVVHRLDRTTSGVVVMAKRRELVAFYTSQFERRETDKRYIAIAHGRLVSSRIIELPLIVREGRPVEVGDGGKPSRTDVDVLEHCGAFTRLAIKLHSGRKHQIRVHLAAIGHPLVDDFLYGGGEPQPNSDRGGPLLHAAQLELEHRHGHRLRFEAPLPPDMES